jgi:molybdenum cofactor cytidylyltransferase
VLAAGESSRMGRPKLLLPWGETTVLGAVLRVVSNSSAKNVLTVTGAHRAATERIADSAEIPTIHNPNFSTGEMVSSLQVALPLLDENHAALVVLGDMPLVSAEIINAIIDTYRKSDARVVAPTFNGKRGHPVLFAPELFDELLELSSGTSAPREVVQRYKERMILVPVNSEGILADIDTPEAYEQFRPKSQC